MTNWVGMKQGRLLGEILEWVLWEQEIVGHEQAPGRQVVLELGEDCEVHGTL